jgi:phosphatidylglycerophosphate synthase
MSEIEKHKRTNDILLGPLERPALHWLAAHMPAWVTPDTLTVIGVLGGVIVAAGYALTNYSPWFLWLASFGFVINWFGDSLDGSLARYRDIQRPRYGFFIDHTVDALIETLIVLSMGLSPYIRFDLAALVLIGYLLLSVFIYITMLVTNEFRLSYGKFGPTEVRVIAILANALIFFIGNPTLQLPVGDLSVYDLLVVIVAFALLAIYVTQMMIKGRQLAREDQPKSMAVKS